MEKQSWKITPQSTLGWWSVILIIVTPVLFVVGSSFQSLFYESIPAGDTILADITARPALALTMLAGMLTGVMAFVSGLLAILRKKERAIFVFASSILGALLIVFLAGELFFQH